MIKVAWSTAHQEFIISDHYYFSKLQRYTRENNIIVDEIDDIDRFAQYDTVVFNYPEIPFKKEEVHFLSELIRKGKKILILGYYKNEDKIADTCNSLTEEFGIIFNGDIVADAENNYEKDDLLLTTTKIKHFKDNVNKIMLACTDSITITNDLVEPIVYAEDTAISRLGKEKVLFAEYRDLGSGGALIAGGTCVFWDNYSIDLYNNKEFALDLLAR
ncbi:MAG: hypothetical protein GXO22_07705 [Aquificae bacterium]|nr:hypothetical protein [Aquificota bacterium]